MASEGRRITNETHAENKAAQERALKLLRDWVQPGDRVACVTVHGRGQTDWVEVFLPSTHNSRPTVERVTFYVARAIGRFGSLEKGIPLRGGNYSKSHEIVSSLGIALFDDPHALIRDDLLNI